MAGALVVRASGFLQNATMLPAMKPQARMRRQMDATDGVIVKGTHGVAVAGLAMWAWLPSLETVSALAVLWVPILSAGWLILQILAHLPGLVRKMRGRK